MRIIFIFLIIVLLLLSLIACQSLNRDNNSVEDSKLVVEKMELPLYFASNKYIQTGDANLDKLLVENRKVTISDIPIAEIAVKELMKGPQSKDMGSVIPSRLKLLGVEVADNIAYINFSGDNMSGGSMEESFLVDAVIMTLTELDNIQAVQFLVDGKKLETLMGHIYTMEPMSREDTVMKH